MHPQVATPACPEAATTLGLTERVRQEQAEECCNFHKVSTCLIQESICPALPDEVVVLVAICASRARLAQRCYQQLLEGGLAITPPSRKGSGAWKPPVSDSAATPPCNRSRGRQISSSIIYETSLTLSVSDRSQPTTAD